MPAPHSLQSLAYHQVCVEQLFHQLAFLALELKNAIMCLDPRVEERVQVGVSLGFFRDWSLNAVIVSAALNEVEGALIGI